MKRILFLIFCTSMFLIGCMPLEEDSPSVMKQMELFDAQRMHYRPVHHAESRWLIIDNGNTLVLNTGMGNNLRASTRRAENRIVMRYDGMIIGNVSTTADGAIIFKPVEIGKETASSKGAIKITCTSQGEALIFAPEEVNVRVSIKFDREDSVASSKHWHVKRYSRRRFLVSGLSSNDVENQNTANNDPLELPFNALGTLIFNSDEIPLNARFALASYVSSFHFACN